MKSGGSAKEQARRRTEVKFGVFQLVQLVSLGLVFHLHFVWITTIPIHAIFNRQSERKDMAFIHKPFPRKH